MSHGRGQTTHPLGVFWFKTWECGGQTADDFKNIKLCCISETSSHSLPALKIPTMQWKRLTWQRRRLDNSMLHAVTCRTSLVRFPGIWAEPRWRWGAAVIPRDGNNAAEGAGGYELLRLNGEWEVLCLRGGVPSCICVNKTWGTTASNHHSVTSENREEAHVCAHTHWRCWGGGWCYVRSSGGVCVYAPRLCHEHSVTDSK